ncbi:RDD family protein [Streptomyces sp. NBC_01275]|uniref:RDD family protein n=1 Tax=Streptomyces sp. NBC_01275 TaxID=2903807 RepID=UPI0022556B33|nr:RDD family protein [Streptomyces sp. NBC_01275]MCX4762479.1 RDD family protein [Streptomyces sp. NBC_01275]
MTTEPPPGSGGPPEDDPFRKQPPHQPEQPPQSPRPPQGGGSPYDTPYDGEPPSPYDGGGGTAQGGGPYGGGPHGGDPYGGFPADPLAGMPPLAQSGRRTLARIVDMILVFVVVVLLAWVFRIGQYTVDPDDLEFARTFGRELLTVILYVAYDTVMTARGGQTLGKKWLGMRVANLDNGSTPSVQTSLVRALVLWVPFACCACLWTAVCGGWSYFDKPYQQGLHDKAAKTVVVSTP